MAALVACKTLTVALLLVAVALPATHTARAQDLPRVASINLCTDQLVMLLAEPQQIVALSKLSRDIAGSYFHKAASEFPQVDPIAEDLLPLKPDVLVAGPYTSRYTLNLLDELDIRVETLAIANSIDDMLGNVQRMGELLDQKARAQAIVNDVRERLDVIQERVHGYSAEDKPRVAVYDTNGYTVGSQTVRGQSIELSGWTNVATSQGIDTYGVLGLEQLINLEPQALIESPYSKGTYSRGQMLAKHPAILASGLDPLIITVASNQTICAGPWTVDIIEYLLEKRAAF